MPVKYMPVFIENFVDGTENGAWMHDDERIITNIMPRAHTSDLGVLRLRVRDLPQATELLKESGFVVRQKSGVIEVVPSDSHDFNDILKLLNEKGIYVEPTAIIPGIYQG
jgi:hypothetical protein